jgi:glycosyltransferase involved in cell wall biosynthesis
VLNVRVVTGAGGGPDVTLIRSGNHSRRYWSAVAYMHARDDAGFAALWRLAAAHAYPLVGIPDRGPLDPRVARELLALCRHLQVRIWHGRDYKANAMGLLLRRLHPMALVTTAHGWVTHTPRTPLYYAVDRFCVRRYDHVIAVSPDLLAAVRALGVPAARCSLLLNGVDEQVFVRRFPAAQSPLRTRRGVAPNRLVVGTAGRLSAEKGFDDLIRATHALIRAGCDVELWIAGEGPARSTLQALIDQLGLGDRIALLGWVEDTVELLHALDLYALSSVREGLPIALLEAMSMRLPVVATSVGGVVALVGDGENGVLVAPRDVDGLATAMRRLLDDPPLRDRLGVAARRTIEERFTLAARVAAEEAIYDRLLAGAAPSARAGGDR